MNKTGFTLVEVLVVVLIIGILTAVALPQYNQSVARSRFATLKHVACALRDAQEVYYATFNRYAEDLNDLDVSFDKHNCAMLGKRAILCHEATIKMRYAAYFYNTKDEYAGQQRCSVVSQSTNGVGHRICQRETGLNHPTSVTESSDIAHYFY